MGRRDLLELCGNGTQGNENASAMARRRERRQSHCRRLVLENDDDMRSLDRLWKMYLETVGRNSTLILNIPPTRPVSCPTHMLPG